MADTIVDPVDKPNKPSVETTAEIEPVPPTQRDPLPQAPAAAAEAPEPPPALAPESTVQDKPPYKRAPKLALAFVATILLLGLSALFAYLFFVRYEPTARAHVPLGTNVAIRLEGADIVLFGPVRDHLLPIALGQGPAASAPAPKAEKQRATKILDKTGVRLPIDVREVVVASMDGRSWVGLFGGRIERRRFVAGLAEVAKEENWPGFHREGDLLFGPTMVIGQADDGTIVVGSDKSIVEASLPASDEGAKLGLPEGSAVSFVIAEKAWEASRSLGLLSARAASLSKISRGTGTFSLGKTPELKVRLEPATGQDPASIAESVRSTLSDLSVLLLMVPDVAGEKEALRQASVEREGDVVVVRAPWPYEGLDRGAATLAEKLLDPTNPK